MQATHNFTTWRGWTAIGLACAAVVFLFAFRSLRMVPGEMFPSFALFLCFLAAMAGASSRTVWAGIAQGSAYALILRWLFGTQFSPSVVASGESLCCVLPLLAAFCAFVLFHRFTNAFYERHKPLAINLLSACRISCLVLACFYAALGPMSPMLTTRFVNVHRAYSAPLQTPAFTSTDSYFDEVFLEKQKPESQTGTGIQFVSLNGIAKSETLNASVGGGSGAKTTGLHHKNLRSNIIRGLTSFNP